MAALQKLIDLYKNQRKQNYLNRPSSYKNKYAFVGIGNHSIANLYPILDYFAVPLKYIVTSRIQNAQKIALKYKNCSGIDNISLLGTDNETKGVFVCTNPNAHFSIVKQLLENNKNVFVEKPPCKNLTELKELIQLANNKIVLVGVQKRYSKINSILKRKAKEVVSYNYKYLTGAYPEGNELLDIFIHPLDNCIFLFGEVQKMQFKKVKNEAAVTYFVTLEHRSGTVGMVELSTAYSWSMPKDELTINTNKGVFEANYPNLLTHYNKPKSFLNIPIEKVMVQHPEQTILYQNNGFVPISEYNSLSSQGYFSEIETFINLCEDKNDKNLSSLESLLPTYELLGQF